MKKSITRQSVITAFFIFFIFIMLAGTSYISRNEFIKVYSGYLNEPSGITDRMKPLFRTTYEVLKKIDTNVYRKRDYINIYGLAQRITGNRYVYDSEDLNNDVVKLDNGFLSFVRPKIDDLTVKAEKFSSLNNLLKGKGIDLLYVQLPFKINKLDKGLPTGIYDYSNENSDIFLSELKSRNVSTFDLREEIAKDGLDHYSLFFRTDHHWKPEAGLWATGKICEQLNTGFGYHIDISLLDSNKFSSTVYKKSFLGSQGKRTGQYYTGVDDFTLLMPEYKTDMSCSYNRVNGEIILKKGSFEDSFIFTENLIKPDYFKINSYATYSGGEYPLLTCTNNLIAGKKILILRDSFSDVVIPYLSLAACNELHAIDPRYYEGSIVEYIEEFNPDIVLILYTTTSLGNPLCFEF